MTRHETEQDLGSIPANQEPTKGSKTKKGKKPHRNHVVDDPLDIELEKIADRLRADPSDPAASIAARQATAVILATETLVQKRPFSVEDFTKAIIKEGNPNVVIKGLNIVRTLREHRRK